MTNLKEFCDKVMFKVDMYPTSLHHKSEELLRTVYELGGLLPTQVKSEAKIDGIYSADHLIKLDKN